MSYTEMENITSSKLILISERARKEPKFQFPSLAHLLNEGFLKECYYDLGRDLASGMDGISGNRRAIERFHYVTKRLVLKWINRRSQKASLTWEGFEAYLKHYPLPEPRIVLHL